MIPDATGRYCNSCKKSVIDFTAKTDEEIQQFISNPLNHPLCGRFKYTQVHRIVIDLPQNIFSTGMPLWMRFLVACLLIFGISIFPFETTVAGKAPTEISFYQGKPIAVKSTDKKSQKRKRKKRITKLVFINMEPLGMISMHPTPGILDSISDTSFNLFVKSAPHKIDKSAHLAANNAAPQKETPRPTPYMPTEFILPSILVFRKENNGGIMD